MQSISFVLSALVSAQAAFLGSFAGDASVATASPKTIVNLGQMQVEKKNTVVQEDHGTLYNHGISSTELPSSMEMSETRPSVEQTGPAVIRGCYKEIPIVKTQFKTIHGFNTVTSQVKEMVPETKVVKTFRTVERVVKDVVPDFKTVEYMRPEYRTVTNKVPFTKEIPYKVKSIITEQLPPTIIPEPHHFGTCAPPCSHHELEGAKVGSPDIKVKVGSLANHNQA